MKDRDKSHGPLRRKTSYPIELKKLSGLFSFEFRRFVGHTSPIPRTLFGPRLVLIIAGILIDVVVVETVVSSFLPEISPGSDEDFQPLLCHPCGTPSSM
jgi:hypothetical protein